MHIEPGYIAPAKILIANATVLGVLGYRFRDLFTSPANILKTGLAAVFFSVFMQSFHASVGPSELHFIGASAIYLLFGFTATFYGFALGLLIQGLLFDPGDLIHLSVNSLSLMIPLIVMHHKAGKDFFNDSIRNRLSMKSILKLDAIYYAGVTTMVGFWLIIGDVATPFADWFAFATSYLLIVACEPLLTWTVVRGLKKHENNAIVSQLFSVDQLELRNSSSPN